MANGVIVTLLCMLIGCSSLVSRAEVVSYPAPQGEPLSTDYVVEADGKPVPVYNIKSQWHDKKYSAAYFDFSGSVTVKIKSVRPLDHLVIFPKKYGIKPTVANGQAIFTTDKPFNISFEPTGQNSPLALFGNPIEQNPPKQGDPNVIYFGPGIHKPTRIDLTAGQTLYIAGGAVVKSAVTSTGDNIRIMGRGILDGNDWPHSKGPTARMVWPTDGRNIIIQDIIIRGAWNWTVAPSRCDQVLVSNLKICGSRCGNDDGIDPCNSSNVTITNCFLHTDDDSIAVKGTARSGQNPLASENIVVTDCTFWVDFANAFRIGYESRSVGLRNFTATNIDIIHFPDRDPVQVFVLQPSDNMPMENLLFENIRINGERPLNLIRLTPMVPIPRRRPASRPVAPTSSTARSGAASPSTSQFDTGATDGSGGRANLVVPGDGPYIHNVTFKNIQVVGENKLGAAVYLKGLSETHNVENVAFENIMRHGELLTATSPDLSVGSFVSQIRFTLANPATQPTSEGR